MEWTAIIFVVICGAVALVGATGVVYQIYHMTVLDAEARGLKRPKLWGIFAMSGNNSSGLVMYLIGRRKHPVINMSESIKKRIEAGKKAAGIGLIFLAIGSIGVVISIALL